MCGCALGSRGPQGQTLCHCDWADDIGGQRVTTVLATFAESGFTNLEARGLFSTKLPFDK